MNKEKNFISAVIFLRNNAGKIKPFFTELSNELNKHFENYELIAVNDSCSDSTIEELSKWAISHTASPLTIIHMSAHQSREACMNAGIDATIGDFVYEFDSVDVDFPWEYVYQAYEIAIKGNDVVSISPKRIPIINKFFYTLFNRHSRTPYKIRTNAFRLISRRALHRVHAICNYMTYRKAAYAASGLKCTDLEYSGKCIDYQENRIQLAIESMLLYTQFGYRITSILSITMLLITLFSFIYIISVYCLGNPVSGWTTTTLLLSTGLTGLFIGNTIAVKYLALLLELHSKRERYLINNIEKIQK